jgi:hypothetical protein
MRDQVWLALCALVLVGAGCAHQEAGFKAEGFGNMSCDVQRDGFAFCDARARARRFERLEL